MGASDFKINSRVRSVLARHWIDLNKVGLSSISGTVRLTGILCRLSSESDVTSFTGQHLAQLESELLSIREVKRVYFNLDNWCKNENRQWTPVKVLKIGSDEEKEEE